MPIDDWKKNPTYEDGVVYISGHTHRNFFHDDGIQRVYADNQNGYFGRHPSFKCIYCDDIFDPFITYEDGIYEITKFDYILFYRARRMCMQLSRKYSTIYLLKKNNNYCFLARLNSGKLSILNGGRGKSLSVKDVNYYYDSKAYVPGGKSTTARKRIKINKNGKVKLTLQPNGGVILF